MQRPPSMPWSHANSFAQPPSTDSRTAQLQRRVEALTDSGYSVDSLATKEYSLASLAALSLHLWPVIYPSSNKSGSSSDGIKSHRLWKADFVELAGDTWLRTAGTTANSSSLAVYHIMNIMLHGNLSVLQCFAHSHSCSEARDPEKSSTGREVHAWLHGRHYTIARWHAENLINAVENAFVAPPSKAKRQDSRMPPSMSSSSSTETARLPFEAPHVPYAIYFATLILWCGEIVGDNTSSSVVASKAHLARGEQLLSQHRVHIAQLLARVLKEVK